MDGYDESTYGDRHAEVYDEWYGDDGGVALTRIGTPADVANGVAGLAGGGPVLELGVGTGRLALALADHGLDALKKDKHLARGLNVMGGKITYPAVAEAMGGHGVTAADTDTLAAELEAAFGRDTFSLIACPIGTHAYDGKL